MKKLNKKGFTIVELVIVIAVIAILAGVLIPTFAAVVEKANKSSAEQQARNFYTLVEAATAAPTTYTKDDKTYTLSLQPTGLIIKGTGTETDTPKSMEILQGVLGEDAKIYDGAKVASDGGTADTRTITKIYFQPKDSKYYVVIDLVAGTVSEAEKVEDNNSLFTENNTITLSFTTTPSGAGS